jgi:hypothetical protein
VSARPHFPPDFEQHNGGRSIDTSPHHSTPTHQPPLSDEAHNWRQEQAEENERIERIHTACDRAIFALFAMVLLVVLADRYAHLLPGGGL